MIETAAAQLLLNRPLALHRDALTALLQRGGDNTASLAGAKAQVSPPPRSYAVTAGVAVIPVRGLLLDKPDGGWRGCTYSGIRSAAAQALADPAIRAIVMHVDSPGGVVTGCLDTADALHAMRGSKPLWAIVDEAAFSAAYALASACDRVTVPRTGGTGSIGVVAMHADVSRALDGAGIKISTIQYGARKTDRSGVTPLTDPARARMQADVDAMGEMFVDLVARNRGMTAAKVKATEAGTFLGAAGVTEGLADEVLSADRAFLSLLAKTNQGIPA